MIFSLINWEYEVDGSFLSLPQVSELGNEGACYFLTIQGFASSLCPSQTTRVPVLSWLPNFLLRREEKACTPWLTWGFLLSLQSNDLPCGGGRPQPEPERRHRAVCECAEDRGAPVLEQPKRGCRVRARLGWPWAGRCRAVRLATGLRQPSHSSRRTLRI